MPFIRKKLVAGNWKMNKTRPEAVSLVQAILESLGTKFGEVEVVICPPFTAIADTVELLGGHSTIAIGAQNVHEKPNGAYTGEISAQMLRDLYVRWVILGHSERRQYFGETDALVNTKAKACFPASLRPIICVGEKLSERDANKVEEVLTKQTTGSCANFSESEWGDIVIAYEPIWAIGTGRVASPQQAQDAHKIIRNVITKMAGETVAQKVRILYGGSVKPENAAEILNQPDVDGALVGGASLEARSFVSIVKAAVPEKV